MTKVLNLLLYSDNKTCYIISMKPRRKICDDYQDMKKLSPGEAVLMLDILKYRLHEYADLFGMTVMAESYSPGIVQVWRVK